MRRAWAVGFNAQRRRMCHATALNVSTGAAPPSGGGNEGAVSAEASTTIAPGPYRRVGNIFIVHCDDHPFKHSWEVNRMLRELRLEFKGQTTIVPDIPPVRKQIWRVRHVVKVDALDLDEAKALIGVPEHISFSDLASQIPPSFGRVKAVATPVIRSKMNFMKLRRMRLRDVLHRDSLELRLLELKRKAMTDVATPEQRLQEGLEEEGEGGAVMLRYSSTHLCKSMRGPLVSRPLARFLRRSGVTLVGPARSTFLTLCRMQKAQSVCVASGACRPFCSSVVLRNPKKSSDQLVGTHHVQERYEKGEGGGEDQKQEDPFGGNAGVGYLPFPPPFHTINVVMLLFLANVVTYVLMNFSGNDGLRDFIVEHFTLSHENAGKIYPFFTNALYQENLLQLLIDCWLLWEFGKTMLGFLGNARMTFFASLCTVGGGLIHVARQNFELYYGMDPLDVRGRCYGPNPFILGLVGVEGIIFRHLNFIQQPPVPFLVLTAFVMVIDVWRIFTTKPEEHGAATGGALVAYLFWALPTRMFGLDKLTAAL